MTESESGSVGSNRPNDAERGPETLTQYCPKCEYDLCGLPANRCPECGTVFDRDRLPLRWRGEPKLRPGANWLLFMSVLAGMNSYSVGDGELNTVFQLVRIAFSLLCGVMWAWLRRAEWLSGTRAYLILWLLLPCAAAGMHEPVPKTLQTAASVFAILSCAAILFFAIVRSPRQSLAYLLLAVGFPLTLGAALLLFFSLGFYLAGVQGGYQAFGSTHFAVGAKHLIAAGYALNGGLVGLAMCAASIRLQSP